MDSPCDREIQSIERVFKSDEIDRQCVQSLDGNKNDVVTFELISSEDEHSQELIDLVDSVSVDNEPNNTQPSLLHEQPTEIISETPTPQEGVQWDSSHDSINYLFKNKELYINSDHETYQTPIVVTRQKSSQALKNSSRRQSIQNSCSKKIPKVKKIE